MQICVGSSLGANVLLDYGGQALTDQIRISEHAEIAPFGCDNAVFGESDFPAISAILLAVDKLINRVSGQLISRGMNTSADSIRMMYESQCKDPTISVTERFCEVVEFAAELQHHYFQEI